MKKNENGYPCFNPAPTGRDVNMQGNNSGVPNDSGENRNQNEVNRTQRPREGCSRNGMNVQSPNGYPAFECDEVPLAYVYAPTQKFCMLYTAQQALSHGTLFENLYKPMGVYGNE